MPAADLARRIADALSVPLRGVPGGTSQNQFTADIQALNAILCRQRQDRDNRSYATRLTEARAEWIERLLREALNTKLDDVVALLDQWRINLDDSGRYSGSFEAAALEDIMDEIRALKEQKR